MESLLRSLVKEHDDCKRHLPEALFACRATFNPTVCASPFSLNHGCEPAFPNKKYSVTGAQHHPDHARGQAKLANPAEVTESYSADDKVYLFSPVLHDDEKLAFKKYWNEPYEVVKKINSVML